MRNKKGILLLEVIVALAVLTVGLTMISRSFANCIRVLETALDYNAATFLAEKVLLDLETSEPETWLSGGGFEENPRFTWQQENNPVEDSGLNDVTLNINWERRKRDYKLTINTFM